MSTSNNVSVPLHNSAVNVNSVTYLITVAESRFSKTWRASKVTWRQFKAQQKEPRKDKLSQAAYELKKPKERVALKDAGGYVAGYMIEGQRLKGAFGNRCLVVLDADHVKDPDAFLFDLDMALDGIAYIVVSTRSHNPSKGVFRYRIIAPLDILITDPDMYSAASRKMAELIGIKYFDHTTFQHTRLMFNTSISIDQEFFCYESKATAPISVKGLLGMYADWTDRSEWACVTKDEVVKRAVTKMEDPMVKKGAAGLFCRAWDIHDAIAEFLSDVYVPGESRDKYTYVGATTEEGVTVYDDKFVHIYHASDPLSGRSLNAFDLVRLHKFGDLDDDAKQGTPINSMPSQIAMCDFVSNDQQCVALAVSEAESSIYDDFDNIEDAPTEKKTYKWVLSSVGKSGELEVKGFDYGLLGDAVACTAPLLFERPKAGQDPEQAYLFDGVKYVRSSSMDLINLIARDFMPSYANKKYADKSIHNNAIHNLKTKALKQDKVCLAEDFDTQRGTVHFGNGWLDMYDLVLSPHSREILSTRVLGFDWMPIDAPTPNIDAYMDTVFEGDQERITCVMDLIAAAASGERVSDERMFFVFQGAGGSGKTTLTNMMCGVLDGAAHTMDIDDIEKPEELIETRGMSMVLFSEMSGGRRNRKVTEQLKKMTGDEPYITARALYEKPTRFRAPNLLVGVTNHTPLFSDSGEGDPMGQRLKIIPFSGNIKKPIPRFYESHMKPELPAFLSKCLRQWKAYRDAGGLTLVRVPSICARAGKEQALRNDHLLEFLDGVRLVDLDNNHGAKSKCLKTAELYKVYSAWATQQGYRTPILARKFHDRMEQYHRKKGYIEPVIVSGGHRRYAHVRLTVEMQDVYNIGDPYVYLPSE